jgi:hypothetical protein
LWFRRTLGWSGRHLQNYKSKVYNFEETAMTKPKINHISSHAGSEPVHDQGRLASLWGREKSSSSMARSYILKLYKSTVIRHCLEKRLSFKIYVISGLTLLTFYHIEGFSYTCSESSQLNKQFFASFGNNVFVFLIS